jgi:hypothetical protein
LLYSSYSPHKNNNLPRFCRCHIAESGPPSLSPPEESCALHINNFTCTSTAFFVEGSIRVVTNGSCSESEESSSCAAPLPTPPSCCTCNLTPPDPSFLEDDKPNPAARFLSALACRSSLYSQADFSGSRTRFLSQYAPFSLPELRIIWQIRSAPSAGESDACCPAISVLHHPGHPA